MGHQDMRRAHLDRRIELCIWSIYKEPLYNNFAADMQALGSMTGSTALTFASRALRRCWNW